MAARLDASSASRTGACARPRRSRRLKETGARALAEGNPEKVVDKVVEGRLSKYYEEVCLYDQPFIKDNTLTIGQLIATQWPCAATTGCRWWCST